MKKKPLRQLLIIFWIYLSVNFGAAHYFFGNDNLDDPDLNIIIPILKDIFWVVLVVTVYFFSDLALRKRVFFYLLIVFGFHTIFLGLIYILNDNIDMSFVKFSKNQILYVGLTILFIDKAFIYYSSTNFLRLMHSALLVSMALSLLLFFFSPVQSHTGRLFGTYGSPNSAGLISVFAFAFYFAIHPVERSRWRALSTLILGSLILIYAASITAFIATLILLQMMYLLRPAKSKNILFYKILVLTFPIFLFSVSIVAILYIPWLSEDFLILKRIAEFLIYGFQYESLSIRLLDYQKIIDLKLHLSDELVQMDGSLATLSYNFSIFGFIYLVLMFCPPLFEYLLRYRSKVIFFDSYFHVPVLVALMLVIVTMILPLQLSFEVFPTNFLIASVIGVLANDFRKMSACAVSNSSRI